MPRVFRLVGLSGGVALLAAWGYLETSALASPVAGSREVITDCFKCTATATDDMDTNDWVQVTNSISKRKGDCIKTDYGGKKGKRCDEPRKKCTFQGKYTIREKQAGANLLPLGNNWVMVTSGVSWELNYGTGDVGKAVECGTELTEQFQYTEGAGGTTITITLTLKCVKCPDAP